MRDTSDSYPSCLSFFCLFFFGSFTKFLGLLHLSSFTCIYRHTHTHTHSTEYSIDMEKKDMDMAELAWD
ncbi:hypothetical protein BDW59DRAFT_43073 [Aspergillus cavernicola]|uniref:Uncharacterized protein n=1 Tax=Aspergillus cavernicola TaxID=176166 RepID=A0ABR4ILQ6_9EURO